MRGISLLLIGLLGCAYLAVLSTRIAQDAKAASPRTFWSASLRSEKRISPSARRMQYITRKVQKKKYSPESWKRREQRIAQNPVQPSPRIKPLLPVVDQSDIKLKHRKIADETLRALPSTCRSKLKSFYVRYDNPKRRGLGGKSTIILNGNVPDDEFRALLVHEFAHVTDIGCLTGTRASGPSAFKDGKEVVYKDDPSVEFYNISWLSSDVQRTGVKSEDFVSGYASWDPFEDLAESVVYYALHEDAFRQRARQNAALARKLQWIETYVFPQPINIATGKQSWDGKVPWDITKLDYAWHPGVLVSQR